MCGTWLLGGGHDGALRVWSVEVARLPVEVAHDGPVVGGWGENTLPNCVSWLERVVVYPAIQGMFQV